MFELKKYSRAEMAAILGTRDRQNMKKKLNSRGIEYTIDGRGEYFTITLTAITDPFKLFCIEKLGFEANTDFRKVRNLYYYYFNDDDFMAMPDEEKEARLTEYGKRVCRQTISKYLSILTKNGYVYMGGSRFIYYFAMEDKRFKTDDLTYRKAWREYWLNKDAGMETWEAIAIMKRRYGGVARKHVIPELNAFFLDEINQLNDLVCKSLENEVAEKSIEADN